MPWLAGSISTSQLQDQLNSATVWSLESLPCVRVGFV